MSSRLCKSLSVLLLGMLLGACQSSSVPMEPTVIPFPTVTPGSQLNGVLPTRAGLTLDGSGAASPATAIALVNQPTATPDYTVCPGSGSPEIPAAPATGRAISAAIGSFLNAGGSPLQLGDVLGAWEIVGETGLIRSDLDFTGEGTADVLLTYIAPDDGGVLLALSCVGGQYQALHEAITGGTAAPTVLQAGDMNFDSRPDVLYANELCAGEDGTDCTTRTQLITWNAELGRFVSLLNGAINSPAAPTLSDVDDDRVQEIVVRLTDDGNATTGPLRTGVNIYDWNGVVYTLSIVQLDPPAFQIQLVHEADRAFARQEMEQAIAQYTLALTDPTLRFWLNDEPAFLRQYVTYRLILAYAFTENENLLTTYQQVLTENPDPNVASVYVALTNAFWNGLQVTNNLHSACLEVQAIISQRPEATGFLNRYGSRSPTYTAQELCPF
jgi:hypothetical protein